VIAPYHSRRQAGAENGLIAAVPGVAEITCAVAEQNGVIRIIRGGVQIIIAILIVHRKDIVQTIAHLGELPYALPAARLRTGRQNIRVQVVVSAQSPTVQMQVSSVHAFVGQLAQLGGAFGKGDQLVIFVQIY